MDISDAIINETIGILRDKFKQDPYTINDNYRRLLALGNVVQPTETLNVVTEDRMTVSLSARRLHDRTTS